MKSLICGFCMALSLAICAQATPFTYQGKLAAHGTPANGLFDFRFTLFDGSDASADVLTDPLGVPAVQVSGGMFTATLDFTNDYLFDGTPLWLEIEVSPGGSNAFTALAPFQPLTAAPYAIRAGSASSISGSIAGNQVSNVQLLDQPLRETAFNSQPHSLYSSNTFNGSSFFIYRVGNSGYADIGFFTAPNMFQAIGNPTLRFAIGVAPVNNVNASRVYDSPYLEMYSGESFWYVTAGQGILGGVRGSSGANKFNFAWFRDGNTNHPMMEIDRQSNTITNYSPVTFESGLTVHAGQLNGNGAGLTNLNPGGLTTNVVLGGSIFHFVNGVLVSIQ